MSDQDSEFLRFVERHDLKPGQVVRVEDRDTAADSVRLRGERPRVHDRRARGVEGAGAGRASRTDDAASWPRPRFAQTAPNGKPAVEPFAITDNSFLVEEAFNQEAGIFQNIAVAIFVNGNWGFNFTQEWPVVSQAHQFSYSVSALDNGSGSGIGDTLLNYRYQAMTEGPGRPAFSPRVSLVLPTGDVPRLLGSGSPGLQVNLPFSKQSGDWYWHGNGGVTWLPRSKLLSANPADDNRVALVSPFLAASAIYRLRPMFNVMLESMVRFDELVDDAGTIRETAFVLSPGARGGWNLGDQQLILGAAMPVTWIDGSAETGFLVYLSYELPFKKP